MLACSLICLDAIYSFNLFILLILSEIWTERKLRRTLLFSLLAKLNRQPETSAAQKYHGEGRFQVAPTAEAALFLPYSCNLTRPKGSSHEGAIYGCNFFKLKV